MKRILLLFFIIFSYTFSFAQSDTCDINIPEICASHSLFEFPASTSGTAWAPIGTYFTCPAVGQLTMNPSFFFFEMGSTGDFTMTIDPIDEFTGQLLSSPSDLDYVCWGPFSSANACTQLQGPNQFSCSGSSAASETLTIPGAIAGEFYVLLVSNYAAIGSTPPNANIEFTATTSIAGVNPLGGGGFAGSDYDILVCSTDLPFNLIDQLQGFPDDWGYWVDSISGNLVNTIFNPSTDPAGVYLYIIPEGNSCGGDTASLEVNIISASSISITSAPNSCSDDGILTLSASPSGGVFSGTNVSGNIFTPSSSNLGINIISYEYTAAGCAPIIVTQDLTVNESPVVLPSDAVTTNPDCFGDCNGSAQITATLGNPIYNYNWLGEDPLLLCAGNYDYIVTDANGCTFEDNVTIYDPANDLGLLTSYNSSCYGTNDGAISITMNGGVTPPGTVSLLSYCLSSPATDFIDNNTGGPQQSAIIEEVILNGDGNNINNNTAAAGMDYYEDYTNNGMYADITEGQVYTIDFILNDISGTGAYATGAKVFIDYNIDGDFGDAGEEVGMVACTFASPLIGSINFTVPSTGAFGPTRMRIVSQDAYVTSTSAIGPCDYADPATTNDAPWFGATEDYSIVLNAPAIIASFVWDNGQVTDSISNLDPGTYTVTITPSSGCAAQDSAVILEPAAITFNPTITQISCNSFTDGQVVLNPGGGNGGPYTINWGTADSSALGVGSYLVTVSDLSTITTTNLNACEDSTTIIMVEPPEFNVDFTISSNEICLNDPITLDFDFNQGGVLDFNIIYTENGNTLSAGPFISNGQQQINVYPNLIHPLINTYIITSITDGAGCNLTDNTNLQSQNVRVNSLPDINISVAPNPICVGYNSILSFSTTSNGTPPYVVDYLNGGVTTIETVPAAGSTISVNPTITTVYELSFVTDSKGCESLLTDNTTLVVYEFPQLNTSYPTEFCEDEAIEIDLDFTLGSPPFIIDYTFNGTPTSTTVNNQQSTLSFVSTNPTNIIINTITSNNCPNDINESIAITTNPLPIADISGNYELCDDGEEADILIVTTAGSPLYNIVYADTNGTNIDSITNATSNQTFTTTTSGVYYLLSVTDSKGCESDSMSGFATVIINPLPDVAISAHPTHTDITDPLIYFEDRGSNHISGVWNFDDGQTQASNFNTVQNIYSDTGTYQVSLTTVSIDGCENTAYQTIIISPTFTIYIPNAFTPNNDLDNDYFMPILEGVKNFEMSIYDRAGQRIFKTNEYSNEYCIRGCNATWDGTVNNGEYGTIGVYIYQLIITDINDKVRNFEGAVTLIR
jgi:gliding motility-associated-like protein